MSSGLSELRRSVLDPVGEVGRKFLLVPYHLIGARDMESAILGQYAEYVHKKLPEAPVPGFYLAAGLFKDARELRQRMGDDRPRSSPPHTRFAEGIARYTQRGPLPAATTTRSWIEGTRC